MRSRLGSELTLSKSRDSKRVERRVISEKACGESTISDGLRAERRTHRRTRRMIPERLPERESEQEQSSLTHGISTFSPKPPQAAYLRQPSQRAAEEIRAQERARRDRPHVRHICFVCEIGGTEQRSGFVDSHERSVGDEGRRARVDLSAMRALWIEPPRRASEIGRAHV